MIRTQDEIMKNWMWDESTLPLVSIKCLTYNHEAYIKQTLDGFLIQKTDFPFEVIIHDDASTDGTANIIREYEKRYPLIIKPIYQKENQYSKGFGRVGKAVNPHLKGKYIAMCEGDDYWIDEDKLQKQIAFLENNPDYGMCFTNFNIYHQKNHKFEYELLDTKPQRYLSEYSLPEWIVIAGYTAPMTWVYKRELLETYTALPSCDGTFVLFAHFLANTKVKCLENEVTAVYRCLSESASHSANPQRILNRMKNLMEVKKILIDKYQLPEEMKIEVEKRYYNKGYRLICILGDKEEVRKAKEYCKNIKQKVAFIVTSILPIRKALYWLYVKKNS